MNGPCNTGDMGSISVSEKEVNRLPRAARTLFVAGSPPVYSAFHHSGAVSIVSASGSARAHATAVTASVGGGCPTASPFTPAASPNGCIDGLGRASSAPSSASSLNGSFFGQSVGFKLPVHKQSVPSVLKSTNPNSTMGESGAVNGLVALDAGVGNLVSPPRRGPTTETRGRLRSPRDWTVSELAARLVSEPKPSSLSEVSSGAIVSDRMPPKSPAAFRRANTDPAPMPDPVSPAGLGLFDVHTVPSPSPDTREESLQTEAELAPASASYSAVSVMSFSPSGNEVARMDYSRAPPFRGLSFDDLSLLDRTPRKDRLANMLLSTRGGGLRRFSRSPLGTTPLYGVRVSPQTDVFEEGDSRPCRVCGGRRMRPCFDCNGQGRFQRVEVQNHVVGGEVCRACRGTGMIDCPACAKELYRKARAAAEIKLETNGSATITAEAIAGMPPPGAGPESGVQVVAQANHAEQEYVDPSTETKVTPVIDMATHAWETDLPYVSVNAPTTCTTDGHGIVPL
ncbi:hypothetical protein F1559_004124 [Cyanidiococcus yangmingshanensis]|uniref:Uncharacterized protein n=1 Tax=Cyanidiococcus yangmingshanensis TaxID=2690220 RepID=A0A7J7IGV1_9RHOD|nr:hypothetical protein F1559_004124 [Cyanidiococcus yangmingshanensis]